MKRWAPYLPLVLALSGCTYSVHQVAMGGLETIPEGAHVRHVHAEAEQHVFFYITDNTDFADQAYAALLAQCPRGELRGIEARYSTSHGFLSFTNHMKTTALCVE